MAAFDLSLLPVAVPRALQFALPRFGIRNTLSAKSALVLTARLDPVEQSVLVRCIPAPKVDHAATLDASRYTVTVPNGAAALTAQSVTWISSDTVRVIFVDGQGEREWVQGGAYTLNVEADTFVDPDGAYLSPASSFALTGLDFLAPAVSNVVPTPGDSIASNTPLQFDVTDVGSELITVLWMEYPGSGRAPEVVFDGTNFVGAFTGNGRAPITGGWRYSLSRSGGWPAAPKLVVVPVDTGGNEG